MPSRHGHSLKHAVARTHAAETTSLPLIYMHALRQNKPGLLQRWVPTIDYVPLLHTAYAGAGCAVKPGSHSAVRFPPSSLCSWVTLLMEQAGPPKRA